MKNDFKKYFIIVLVVIIVFVGLFLSIKFLKYNTSNDSALNCKDCNLIIISLTNTRKDHIGFYGYERETSPNINSFFSNSLIFNNVFSPSPWTLPNAVSLFTSTFPQEHGVINRYKKNKLLAQNKTLAAILKDNNYKTAAFTGGGDYSKIYGLNNGFDFYEDSRNFSKLSEKEGEIIYWLKENQNEKFFLFLQGFDTHCPFTSPHIFTGKYIPDPAMSNASCFWNLESSKKENGIYQVYTQSKDSKIVVSKLLTEENKQELIDLYDSEIVRADNFLGRIFTEIENLNLNKKTIIVFLSEHGDLLGEKGYFMRTDILGSFQDVVLNIPLLIKHPKIKEKKEINNLMQIIDIAPTLLGLLNISYDKLFFRGGDIFQSSVDGSDVNQYVYGGLTYEGDENSQFFNDTRTVSMIRNFKNKLIQKQIFSLKDKKLVKESFEFYNIDIDAKELNNIVDKNDNDNNFLYLKYALNKWRGIFNKNN